MKNPSQELQYLEQLYAETISEQLRTQLQVIHSIESIINFSLDLKKIQETFYNLMSSFGEEDIHSQVLGKIEIETLKTKYSKIIDFEGETVSFWSRRPLAGEIPRRINPRFLRYMLISFPSSKGNNPRVKLSQLLEADLLFKEVEENLLPFMCSYSRRYEELRWQLHDLSCKEEAEDLANPYGYYARENRSLVNDLVSEFGEDIFSDRD